MALHEIITGSKRYIGHGKWLNPGDKFIHPHKEVPGAICIDEDATELPSAAPEAHAEAPPAPAPAPTPAPEAHAEAPPAPAPAPAPEAHAEAPPVPTPATTAFPIDGYDDLNAKNARREIRALTSKEELERVLEREKSEKNRSTVIREIQSEIDEK